MENVNEPTLNDLNHVYCLVKDWYNMMAVLV